MASGKWHGNYGVPVPETGRTSSSELIKNRAELDESDIRFSKILAVVRRNDLINDCWTEANFTRVLDSIESCLHLVAEKEAEARHRTIESEEVTLPNS
ncbi:hypothetical protein TNCV_5261 [Trichonephila clavipes]|nr:hypothetical protein TNCV_5261 [Trichonephila clavipes]